MRQPYKEFDDCCYKVQNCMTTVGYIVKRHYYKKLLLNFEIGLSKLVATGDLKRYSCDVYWKTLQNEDNWYLLRPLTVTQWSNHSDVVNGYRCYDNVMLSTTQ